MERAVGKWPEVEGCLDGMATESEREWFVLILGGGRRKSLKCWKR